MDNTGIFPAEDAIKGNSGEINAFALKIIAISTMLCDHASVVFFGAADFTVLRFIGRLGFPIFAFMIAEGARRTRSIPKYMLRLLIFGVVSEIPFDLVLLSEGKSVFDFSGMNVYFTLLAGLFAIYCIRRLKGRLAFLMPFGVLLALFAAWAAGTDYSFPGVGAIILFYLFAEKPKAAKTAGFALAIALPCFSFASLPDLYHMAGEWSAVISVIPDAMKQGHLNVLEIPALISLPLILKYNGERGANFNKFFFYAFYPGHIVLLYLIKLLLNAI